MNKRERIDEIFNVLVQFEKVCNLEVSEQSYLNYLDRLITWYVGYGNQEIVCGLRGLMDLGVQSAHSSVKRMVFHIIDILEGEV